MLRWRRVGALLGLVGVSLAAGLTWRSWHVKQAPALKLSIPSHGEPLAAELLADEREGTQRPLVIFLHGYPGADRNLDLAGAIHASGYQSVLFSPRGMRPSAGEFSFARSLEDVDAVLNWARSTESIERYHIDAARIALVSHSFGGWQALMTAGHEAANVCIAAIAAWNVGWVGARFAEHLDERAANLRDFNLDDAANGGTVRASPAALVAEMADHGDDWNYLNRAATLFAHPLLLVSATRDSPDEDMAMRDALAHAVTSAGGTQLRFATFTDDHTFGAHRKPLADALIRWLDGDCAAAWPAPSARMRR